MSTELLSLNRHLPECRMCHGVVERELVAIYPASQVCIDCMEAPERRKLEDDLNHVQALDRSLLPELPEVNGWEVGIHYRPSRILSGDFYDVRREDDGGRLTLLLGDVMGKGIPAALLRTGLQGALKALTAEVPSPARVLEKANRYFSESSSSAKLASVFYGAVDVEGGNLCFANAGHLPPLVRKADGRWRTLDSTGVVLGALAKSAYAENTVPFDRGDLFVLYSDGITEAQNRAGEFFDERRVTSVIDDMRHSSVQEIASGIADEVSRFAPGEPSDDRTLVVVRRTE
jgi:sigma-B regulation protein RsbU (phosphoserine phosphatase)